MSYFVDVKGYEIKRDTPEAWEAGEQWDEGDPAVHLCVNPSMIPAIRCYDVFAIINVDGKKYGVALDEDENDDLGNYLDRERQTPYIMLQPLTSRCPGIFVHHDHIAEIIWHNKEMTRARVRLALQEGREVVEHEVSHPQCIERLKELCRFYKYWQTHEEYERERKAKAGK